MGSLSIQINFSSVNDYISQKEYIEIKYSKESINFESGLFSNIFYVDKFNGSDNNDGKSINNPWKSLDKVNKINFKPGDTILFKRGQVFNGMLYPRDNDGNSSNPITFGSYSVGKSAIINSTGEKYGCWIRGDYNRVTNITTYGSIYYGFVMGTPYGTNYTVFENCTAYRSHVAFGWFYGGKGGKFVNNNAFDGHTGFAIIGSKNKPNNGIIKGNKAINHSKDGIQIHTNNDWEKAGKGFIISNNFIDHSGEDGIDLQTGENLTVSNNIISNSSHVDLIFNSFSKNLSAYNNLIIGNGGWSGRVFLSSPNVSFYNNIVFGSSSSKQVLMVDDQSYLDSTNIIIHNNAFFYNNDDYMIRIKNTYGNLGKVSMVSNLITAISEKMPEAISFESEDRYPNHHNFDFDNNIYYNPEGEETIRFKIRGNLYNFSSYSELFQVEKNGTEVNPKIKILNNTYIIERYSIIIDNSTIKNNCLDYFEKSIYGKRDIGPIEYQPPYDLGKDNIDISSPIRIYSDGKFRYTSEVSNGTNANLSIRPKDGWPQYDKNERRDQWMDLEIHKWETNDDICLKWKENNISKKFVRRYEVGDLDKGKYYSVNINNEEMVLMKADTVGKISFNLSEKKENLFIEIKEYKIGIECNIEENQPLPVTGKPYVIKTNIENTDNFKDLRVKYWFDNEISRSNEDLGRALENRENDTWQCTIDIPINATYIEYYFVSTDEFGIEHKSHIIYSNIVDDQKPVIIDKTENDVKAESIFLFDFIINDNIGLSHVFLEYWFNEGEHKNISLIGDEVFTSRILIPSKINNNISYRVHVYDIFGNYNNTTIKSLVIDDSMIKLIIDNSPEVAYTGDRYDFDIQLMHFEEINESYIEYWFENESSRKRSVIKNSSDIQSIDIPLVYKEEMNYYVIIKDDLGNYRNSSLRSVEILDNDPPEIIWIDYPTSAICGEEIDIRINITDNSNIGSIFIEYMDHYGRKFTSIFDDSFDTFPFVVPSNTKNLSFVIRATDVFGNILVSTENRIEIIDNIKPVVEILGQNGLEIIDNELQFSIISIDNIGIKGVFLEYKINGENELLYMGLSGEKYRCSINIDDIIGKPFKYRFNVTDVSDNYQFTNYFVILWDDYIESTRMYVVELKNSNSSTKNIDDISSDGLEDIETIFIPNPSQHSNETDDSNSTLQNNIKETPGEKSVNELFTFMKDNILFMIVLFSIIIIIAVTLIIKKKPRNNTDILKHSNGTECKPIHWEEDTTDEVEIPEIEDICTELDEVFMEYESSLEYPSMEGSILEQEDISDDEMELELQEIEDILNLIND